MLSRTIRTIRESGPTRVIVGLDGTAVTPDKAAEIGIFPTTVYIRNDGWSLGCDDKFDSAGYLLWSEDWVCKLDTVSNVVTHIEGNNTWAENGEQITEMECNDISEGWAYLN